MVGSGITVLLPFRNAAATLDAAVRSIVEQRFQQWRLLLVDNASNDAGTELAARWARSDARITLLHEPEVGIAHALNTGLRHADAPYVARMDADDTAHPDRLAMQHDFMRTHDDIGVVGTRTRFATTVEQSAGMEWFVQWQNAMLTPREHYVRRFVDAPIAHPTALFRRSLVERFGGYATGALPEDHELWLRWMHHGVRFAKLPEELLTWNDHPDRLTRTHPNYGTEAFFRTKAQWITAWCQRKYGTSRPIIIAGTSSLCRARAATLEACGLRIHGFTDVKPRTVPGYAFVPHDRLPPTGAALIISFIGQRGTGDRIAAYLASRGLVEGDDFILAA